MKKIVLLPVLFILALEVSAQDVPMIQTDQLRWWKTQTSDTVYVLNFWATWCGPCIAELPEFETLNAAYRDKNVQVVLISTDFRRNYESDVKPFVAEKQLRSRVVFLNEPRANNYINLVHPDWSGAIPATLILNNRKGYQRFFEKKLSYEDLEAAVQAAF